MPWWAKRESPADNASASAGGTDTGVRPEVPVPRRPSAGDSLVTPVSMARLRAALDRLEIRYLTDGDGSLLAMWERHAVLFTLEGPDDEILVMRARPHGTVPPDWADRAYRVVNEWNHSRRFCKAYVGDPTERGTLPIYAEMQVPLIAGAHDALLVELLDCAAAVAVRLRRLAARRGRPALTLGTPHSIELTMKNAARSR